jgi:hypothetical protein
VASPEQYAQWIVSNQDKKGTPEFETVAQAYKMARSEPAPQQAKQASGASNFFGPAEAALSAGSGIVAGLAGNVAGVARTLTSGQFGTPQGIQAGQETARNVSGALTYRPRTELGQGIIEGIGNVLSESKLAGLGPAEAIPLAGVTGPAVNQAARAAKNIEIQTPVPQKQMVGFGSASTDQAALRTERAQQLPVPIKLTKGQAERSFEQIQFEREAAKNPSIGAPLRERFADQNERILQNFDSWLDQTGAQSGSLRATGETVTAAVAEKAKRAKGEITAAYNQARMNGDMKEPLDVTPLTQYLSQTKPESINAPVLTSVAAKLDQISKNGKVTINDLEEVRKMAGNLGGKDATNAHFAKEVKNIIDTMTEGKGGEAYKRARLLRSRYAAEFKNVGVIDKLMRNKPGTTDRAVAYEDVFNETIMKGSLDDVRAVRKTLQTAGPKGQDAWKELQGETVKHLKDEITKNVQIDQRGNRVVSAARLDRLVNELDKDGKLEFIFGKQGAQQIRDVNDIAKDVFTSPPGSVNHSNTASILIGLLDTAVSGTVNLPLPVGTAIHQGVKKLKSNAMEKRVQEAVNYGAP